MMSLEDFLRELILVILGLSFFFILLVVIDVLSGVGFTSESFTVGCFSFVCCYWFLIMVIKK